MRKIKIEKTTGVPFNKENFPELDKSGNTLYYLANNANYGFAGETVDGIWTLIDTDSQIAGDQLESAWGKRNNGQQLLDYTNGLADKYLSKPERHTIIPKDVGTDDCNPEGRGRIKDALLWPANMEEYKNNRKVAGKIYGNSCGDVWSRSFDGSNGNYDYAWLVYGTSGDLNSGNFVSYSCAVAPAFNLDLEKVLIVKSAESGEKAQSVEAYQAGNKTDLKFLVNADSEVSCFTAEPVAIGTDNSITFRYRDASADTFTEYVSAILYDKAGKILYYGNIQSLEKESGEFTVPVPDELQAGEYTLAVFQEKKNPAKMTDFSSEPIFFSIEIEGENNIQPLSSLQLTEDILKIVNDTLRTGIRQEIRDMKNGENGNPAIWLTSDWIREEDGWYVVVTNRYVDTGNYLCEFVIQETRMDDAQYKKYKASI